MLLIFYVLLYCEAVLFGGYSNLWILGMAVALPSYVYTARKK